MKPTRAWSPYLFVAPAILVFAFVVLIPALANTALSFANWSGTDAIQFVGLDNYFRAFRDEIYLVAYRNTFVYILLTLALEVVVGLLLAGLVTMQGRRTTFYRVAFFVPVTLPMIVIAILWSFVYSDDIGLINSGLRASGLDGLTRVWLGIPTQPCSPSPSSRAGSTPASTWRSSTPRCSGSRSISSRPRRWMEPASGGCSGASRCR
nr:hypothetical protein GCM10025699_13530 [Microbacterium flavescens]